jgi:ankyrin repeat protein
VIKMEDRKLTALDGAAETPLHGAAWTGDIQEAKALVAAGADVNHIDSAGETPLHGAAASGEIEMVRYLLSQGARVDIAAKETRGFTPLHWASGWGNLKTVRVLVDAGAAIEAADAYGCSPLDIAREHDRADIVAYFKSMRA